MTDLLCLVEHKKEIKRCDRPMRLNKNNYLVSKMVAMGGLEPPTPAL